MIFVRHSTAKTSIKSKKLGQTLRIYGGPQNYIETILQLHQVPKNIVSDAKVFLKDFSFADNIATNAQFSLQKN